MRWCLYYTSQGQTATDFWYWPVTWFVRFWASDPSPLYNAQCSNVR